MVLVLATVTIDHLYPSGAAKITQNEAFLMKVFFQ